MKAWDGRRETAFSVADVNVTFNSAGAATITHNLGWVPSFIGLTHLSSALGGGVIITLAVRYGSSTSTAFVAEARRHDGTAYVGALRMSWFARA